MFWVQNIRKRGSGERKNIMELLKFESIIFKNFVVSKKNNLVKPIKYLFTQ